MTAGTPFPVSTERSAVLAVADLTLRQQLEKDCAELCPRLAGVDTLRSLVEALEHRSADVVLLDFRLLPKPRERSVEALTRLTDGPSILLLAESNEVGAAYPLVDHGVDDVLRRPPHRRELELRLRHAFEARDLGAHIASLEDAITERSRRTYNARAVVARSPAMRHLSETISRVARMRTTVLVLGESGVGKELVSRNVHFNSPRKDGPFIAINCAALPPHLIESELFGHERGAFTGAVARRAGKFELAHGGTLFLDEIGETDLTTQAKLLRVLETREFMRVGGSRPVKVDVRLVTATNADLEELVASGRFREDLYYRLKVVTLQIPPLRERREDIPDLIDATVSQVCRTNQLEQPEITGDALEALCAYDWPGNVRELMNAIEAVIVASPHNIIDVGDLPPSVAGRTGGVTLSGDPQVVGKTLKEIESSAIRATLAATRGSRTLAAQRLGISVRTLRRRIRELGLDEELPAKPGRPRR